MRWGGVVPQFLIWVVTFWLVVLADECYWFVEALLIWELKFMWY